jgi:hypothetical protein
MVGLQRDNYFGSAIAGVGDLDADGVMDVAIGAEGTSQSRGQVYILRMAQQS